MMIWLIPSVLKLQKETVSTANWKDLWVLGYLTEAEKRRILFTKMPPSWHKMIQLTDTSRELQDKADIATVTSHLTTLESLDKASRLRSTITTLRLSSIKRGSQADSNQEFMEDIQPNRQQPITYGRYPREQLYGGQPYNPHGGQPYHPSNYPRCQQQPQQQHAQLGGRSGYPTTAAFGRGQGFGRSPGGRPHYPSRGGRPQPRNFGVQRGGFGRSSAPTARHSNQHYRQEDAGQYDDRYYQEEQEQVEEEAHMTEEERTLINQWNDNMYISNDTGEEEWYSTEEQYAAEETDQYLQRRWF